MKEPMFYIQKRRPRIGKKELVFTPIVPAIVVFLAFVGLSIWGAIEARSVVRENLTRIRDRNIVQAQTAIQDRLRTYEDILRAGTARLEASSMTRQDWRRFVGVFELEERYPGTQGIGYIEMVDGEQRAVHQERVRADGVLEYKVFPDGERAQLAPIVYLEPVNDKNIRALGYDLYSEVTRRAALDTARDTGETAITDIVNLIQEDVGSRQPGFLMFVPFYVSGQPLETVAQRRIAHRGYVYAPFRAHDLLSQIESADDKSQFSFRVYAGNPTAQGLLYESGPFEAVSEGSLVGAARRDFRVYNRDWTIVGAVDPAIISSFERTRPTNVLWAGGLFSVFVAGFLYLLLLNRSRSVAQKEQRQIQEAKDELLALASHQLRTPATGVKQFIGLLRDGYGGELSVEQKEYVNKAYASNERQLATINEMLLVAKADSGNFKTMPTRFDVVTLVDEILEEQASVIRGREQKLRISTPKNKVYIMADERYIRMTVENMISNATKYTPEGGAIEVVVRRDSDHVTVAVKDTGVGVSEHDRHMLFQKFSRIPNELTNKVTGSGIGLYLAKKIVELHGGTISFERRTGGGSICAITLPMREN